MCYLLKNKYKKMWRIDQEGRGNREGDNIIKTKEYVSISIKRDTEMQS